MATRGHVLHPAFLTVKWRDATASSAVSYPPTRKRG